MSGPSVKELAQATAPIVVKLYGIVRRLSVTISKQVHAWQVTGVKMPGGADEVFRADLFSGVGFVARPPTSGKPEAIVVMASGGGDGAALVGSRDLKTLQAVMREITGGRVDLEFGETVVFTKPAGGAVIYMQPDGTTEIRSTTGTAVALATKADLEELRSWLQGHIHTGVPTGANGFSGPPHMNPVATPIPGVPVPEPAGTTKLKGE